MSINENYSTSINRQQAQNKAICRNIMKEDYGKKEYLNDKKIEEVRQMFKTRVGLFS